MLPHAAPRFELLWLSSTLFTTTKSKKTADLMHFSWDILIGQKIPLERNAAIQILLPSEVMENDNVNQRAIPSALNLPKDKKSGYKVQTIALAVS